MDGFKNDEKFGFNDIIDMNFDKGFEFSIIRLFQNVKTSDIERLGKIRRMCREVEDDNVLFFVEFFKLD